MDSSRDQMKGISLKCRIKQQFKAWGKRFLLAELCGMLLAVAASYTVNSLLNNNILAAYAGAAGDTIGFYTPIIIQDAVAMRKRLRRQGKAFNSSSVLTLVKNMLLEFGPAEVIDSLFLRPFFMYYFPILLHNYPIGILAGKFAGDISFYIPVTISNRLRAVYKRYRT